MKAVNIGLFLTLSAVRSFGEETFEISVNRIVDKAIDEGDIGVVTNWADESDERRDPALWEQKLPHLVTADADRNNIIFALFARCCCFAPRDAIRFLQRGYISPFGTLDVGPRDRFTNDLPMNVAKRYRSSNNSTVVSVSLSDSGKASTPVFVFIGINVSGWKPGDVIELRDIDFVDTNFDSHFWLDRDYVNGFTRRRHGSVTDDISQPGSSRSAPRQPPEGPPSAKPGYDSRPSHGRSP